jgi:hypothetical protein
MGTVLRATDRLTGSVVAYKRVRSGGSDGRESAQRQHQRALTQEFKVLSSLRHPNVIEVLDYGFDATGGAFFTMELLDGAQDIDAAAVRTPTERRIDMVVELLQALTYVHIRGVLHRDLKPGNVLVHAERVCLVDFGIATLQRTPDLNAGDSASGTIAYMAPERFDGAEATPSSDLWAVGLIAYEVLTGRHPFRASNVAALVANIIGKEPDLAVDGIPSAIVPVLARLMAKSPEARFGSSSDAMRALCAAAARALPRETEAIRESFLETATFVGRDVELGHLDSALSEMIEGTGSTWLVGGESGVGKSRLLDEVRTSGLVRGALVLRSRGSEDQTGPYLPWRPILRQLLLYAAVGDEDAALLKSIVPDVDALLDRPLRDPPTLDAQQGRIELFRVVRQLLVSIDRPLLIMLEDLQWVGSESLALAALVAEAAQESRLMLVADYRSDEAPSIPAAFRSATTMQLERLSGESVVELSVAILGQAGRKPEVVQLLSRETEGNTFFLVEVLRALAEEAGRVDHIASMELPEHVYAGGIAALVSRRLKAVGDEALAILEVAAVAGRRIDLTLLAHLRPREDLERWLTRCVEAALVHRQDEAWIFAHDKFREGVLSRIDEARRPAMHREVAEGIEATREELDDDLGTLARLWRSAGEPLKEKAYARRAGEQALTVSAAADAVRYFRRVIELLSASPPGSERDHEELAAQTLLGYALMNLRGYGDPEVEAAYLRASDLSGTTASSVEIAPALYGLFSYHASRAEYAPAIEVARRILAAGEQAADATVRLIGHNALAVVCTLKGELERAIHHGTQAAALADRLHGPELMVLYGGDFRGYARTWLSTAQCLVGDRASAHATLDEALWLTKLHPYTHGFVLAFAETNQLMCATDAALERADRLTELAAKHGFALLSLIATVHRSWALAVGLNRDAAELPAAVQSTAILKALRVDSFVPFYLALIAESQLEHGQTEGADESLREAFEYVARAGASFAEPGLHRLRGELARRRGIVAEADAAFAAAHAVAEAQGAQLWSRRGT